MVSGIVAGRLALVTGAGSGIGRAACQVLSREGAIVIAADKHYDAAVETIKTHTALASGTNDADHMAVELDVSDSTAVRNLLQTTLKQYKAPPTIVVNSAGITRDNWLLKLSEEDYDSVLNTNLKGTFLVMQTFAKAMTEAGLPGSIVNLSSIVGKYGNIGQTNYAGSKAGVIGMTQSAAKELGKFNVRVNAILPGFIETPMVKTVPEKVIQGMMKLVPLGRLGTPTGECAFNESATMIFWRQNAVDRGATRVNAILPGFIETPMVKTVPEKVIQGMMKLVPLGRLGTPTELAEVIAFLSSDKSSFMTGASVDVTGGF